MRRVDDLQADAYLLRLLRADSFIEYVERIRRNVNIDVGQSVEKETSSV